MNASPQHAQLKPPAPTRDLSGTLNIIRWLARLASLVSVGLIALFATSGSNPPSAFEWLLLAFFPLGVVVGMLIAWRREVVGGSISCISLTVFHVLMLVRDGHVPATPWFVIFTLPAIVLLVVGLLDARPPR